MLIFNILLLLFLVFLPLPHYFCRLIPQHKEAHTMCLIAFQWLAHPHYPLVWVANRDEFYDRAAQAAHWWADAPDVLAGKDLSAGGTWAGVRRNGRFAALTNYRDLANLRAHAPTRGKLTTDYLLGATAAPDYLRSIIPSAQAYNGFNLLAGDLRAKRLYYLSNYAQGIQEVGAGLHALSNALLDTPWWKVTQAKAALNKLIETDEVSLTNLLEIFYAPAPAPDPEVQQTGLPFEREKMLSSMFIESENYGTRCTTAMLLDNEGKITLAERSYDALSHTTSEVCFDFALE